MHVEDSTSTRQSQDSKLDKIETIFHLIIKILTMSFQKTETSQQALQIDQTKSDLLHSSKSLFIVYNIQLNIICTFI